MSFTGTYCTLCGSYHDGTACRTANVIRIDSSVNPPSSLPVNNLSRRVALQAAIASEADNQPKWAGTDYERFMVLAERIGDIASASNHGHKNVEDELLRAGGTLLAWLERLERDRAA